MAMVRFNAAEDDGATWIDSDTVRGVRKGGVTGAVIVERHEKCDLYVKGTPDEVHARLFPEPEPTPRWLPGFIEDYAAQSKERPNMGGHESVRDDDTPDTLGAYELPLRDHSKDIPATAESARDACRAAYEVLLQVLPGEDYKRMRGALDAAKWGDDWKPEDARNQPAKAAETIQSLAFAVRRLSGREG